ncbi:NAD-dependent epimerase/dehydratase family protein [Paenibacillus oryzisoli]|uniref:NAD-dependent epimerase/dehydratase family protein n=1 Tax=Paenibacillus oryzisoli TaxID=1850517 RepID=UPI003D2C51B7
MNVLLLGATGMVGQSVLRECLLDPAVSQVYTWGRSPVSVTHAKLHSFVQKDLTNLGPLQEVLPEIDACFFCLGVSSAGMREEQYRAVTYDLTMQFARELVRLQPNLTFLYVTGASTDSTEQGRVMWARVKGKTENDLLKLPFKAAYMFRPGGIIPKNGVRSKTGWVQAIYTVMRPLFPLLEKASPNSITTSVQIGRAMINAARHGYPQPIVEVKDIRKLAEG